MQSKTPQAPLTKGQRQYNLLLQYAKKHSTMTDEETITNFIFDYTKPVYSIYLRTVILNGELKVDQISHTDAVIFAKKMPMEGMDFCSVYEKTDDPYIQVCAMMGNTIYMITTIEFLKNKIKTTE